MYLRFFFLLFLCSFIGCYTEPPTQSTLHLPGLYESSVFVEAGPADGPIDIQASGGYMKILLREDLTFTSDVYIPETLKNAFVPGHTNYEGLFSVKDNLVVLIAPYYELQLIWNRNNQLESPEIPRRGVYKIVLHKR